MTVEDKPNGLGAGGMAEIDRKKPQFLKYFHRVEHPAHILWAVKREIKKDIIVTILLNPFISYCLFFYLRPGSSSLAALCWVFHNRVLST